MFATSVFVSKCIWLAPSHVKGGARRQDCIITRGPIQDIWNVIFHDKAIELIISDELVEIVGLAGHIRVVQGCGITEVPTISSIMASNSSAIPLHVSLLPITTAPLLITFQEPVGKDTDNWTTLSNKDAKIRAKAVGIHTCRLALVNIDRLPISR